MSTCATCLYRMDECICPDPHVPPDGYELVPVEVVDALVSIYYNDTEGLGWASDYATVREWLDEVRHA